MNCRRSEPCPCRAITTSRTFAASPSSGSNSIYRCSVPSTSERNAISAGSAAAPEATSRKQTASEFIGDFISRRVPFEETKGGLTSKASAPFHEKTTRRHWSGAAACLHGLTFCDMLVEFVFTAARGVYLVKDIDSVPEHLIGEYTRELTECCP